MVKTFRHKPFPLYEAIGDLVDGTWATGEGIFHAGRTPTFDHHDSPMHGDSPNSDTNIDPSLWEISNNMQKTLKGKGRAVNTPKNTPVSTSQTMSNILLIYTAALCD